MPDQVFHIAHSAPYRYRPRRGRVERLAMAPLDTTVRLTSVTRAEMPWVGRDGTYRILALHEGALWTTVPPWKSRGDGLPNLAALALSAMPDRAGHDDNHTLFGRMPLLPS